MISAAPLCGVEFVVTKERREKRAQRESCLKGVWSLLKGSFYRYSLSLINLRWSSSKVLRIEKGIWFSYWILLFWKDLVKFKKSIWIKSFEWSKWNREFGIYPMSRSFESKNTYNRHHDLYNLQFGSTVTRLGAIYLALSRYFLFMSLIN